MNNLAKIFDSLITTWLHYPRDFRGETSIFCKKIKFPKTPTWLYISKSSWSPQFKKNRKISEILRNDAIRHSGSYWETLGGARGSPARDSGFSQDSGMWSAGAGSCTAINGGGQQVRRKLIFGTNISKNFDFFKLKVYRFSSNFPGLLLPNSVP